MKSNAQINNFNRMKDRKNSWLRICTLLILWIGVELEHPKMWAQDGLFVPASAGQSLENPSYLVDFDADSKMAFWVHYELKSLESQGQTPRKDAFRADSRVRRSATASDYRGSGYDRGHLKPASDSKLSAQEMSQSFLMTNIFPQTPALNRGIWKSLEEDAREWSVAYGSVHITTGPSVETKGYLASGVRIPSACWKAVLRTYPDTSVVAFFLPNGTSIEGSLSDYVITVDELEERIGLDLFSGLEDDIEDKIEAKRSLDRWGVSSTGVKRSGGTVKRSGVQCMGIATSTGRRCGNSTKNANGYCHRHQNQ